jgi:lipid II:glycine glycyltransferase (peptidoglycan interpeptide bridge formation enzyme)
MKLTAISPETAMRWNGFVAQWPDFALMQSYEWGQFKQALGWDVVRLAVEQDGQLVAGAQMLIRALPLTLSSIAYVPRGPLLDWTDEAVVQTLLSGLHATARNHRTIALKIEPADHHSPEMEQRLASYGFRSSSIKNQPQSTMLIDLRPDTEAILAGFHRTTRYNIRYSARKGVRVRRGNESDLNTLYQLLSCTAERAGFSIRSRDYYHREWAALAPSNVIQLFLAEYDGQILAARMPAAFGGKGATLHSGSFNLHRELKPNDLLMWESIKWAKARGCTIYDVWGIPDEVGAHLNLGHPMPENQTDGLWGVYRFKRGFGGDIVYYIGAYDFTYSPFLGRLIDSVFTRLGSPERLAQLGDWLST